MRASEADAWDKQERMREERWVETIAANLNTLLAAEAWVLLSDRVTEVYGDALGLARDKHVNRAWDRLADAGIAKPREKKVRLERAVIRRAT